MAEGGEGGVGEEGREETAPGTEHHPGEGGEGEVDPGPEGQGHDHDEGGRRHPDAGEEAHLGRVPRARQGGRHRGSPREEGDQDEPPGEDPVGDMKMAHARPGGAV